MVNNEEKKKKDLKVMSHIIIWVVIFCMIFATDKSYRGTGIFLFGILMTYYFLVALFLNKKKLREAERELDKKVLEYKEECNKKIFSLKRTEILKLIN